MLRLLSVDVRAVAVVGPGGEVLAGDEDVVADDGALRVPGPRTTAVLDVGPHALIPLLRADAARVLAALDA